MHHGIGHMVTGGGGLDPGGRWPGQGEVVWSGGGGLVWSGGRWSGQGRAGGLVRGEMSTSPLARPPSPHPPG